VKGCVVMSVRPIDMIMMPQLNEVSQIKQNENTRPVVEQANIYSQNEKEIEVKAEQVNAKDDVDYKEQKYDAKEKSNNEYQGNNKRKKAMAGDDGRVVVKKKNIDFDMKV